MIRRASEDRQRLPLILLVLILGAGLAARPAGAADPPIREAGSGFSFERHEIVTGHGERQTVLTGSFLGGPVAQLAVVHIDEHDDRRLRIHALGEGGWALRIDATLRRDVSFVDVADIDGRERLITYGGGSLRWFDPESATEHELVAVTSDFSSPFRGEVPHVDVTHDVNLDGRDDLAVPCFDGFRVFVRLRNGSFADPVTIGLPAHTGRIRDTVGYRHDPWTSGRIHRMDYDGDGRLDLAYWNEDRFEVHRQGARGLFSPLSESFTTDVAFDSDDLTSLVAPEGVRGRRMDHQPAGELNGRVLYSLADQNGDGVADLVVFALAGGSLWSMHSTYEVHFGARTPGGGTVFAPDVDTAIVSDGIPFGVSPRDLDEDGKVDMTFTVINPGVFKAVGMIFGALLTRSVPLDLEIYRMDDDLYPARPTASRTIRAHTPRESGGATRFPAVRIGDLNGDRFPDLLVGRSGKALRVFPGEPGPRLFARRSRKVVDRMPDHEEHVWLADLNHDGKQDILLHYPAATEPHRLTLLIAH